MKEYSLILCNQYVCMYAFMVFLSNFTEIYFIYNKSPLFKVSNLIVLSVFMELCSHHPNLGVEVLDHITLFDILRNCQLFAKVAALFNIPSSNV